MSSLKKLREEFDRVIIKYRDKSCEVLLIKGLKAFKGLSKCHDNDNFDRKLGRAIALGRAEFAFKVDSGEKSNRSPKIKTRNGISDGYLKYSFVQHGDVQELDEYIIDFLPKRAAKKADKENE